MTEPQRVGDVLGAVLQEAGVRTQVDRARVVDEWAELVGPRISEVSRAVSVDGARLVVEVRSSSWLMELNLMKHEILARVNDGRVEDPLDRIVFVLAEQS